MVVPSAEAIHAGRLRGARRNCRRFHRPMCQGTGSAAVGARRWARVSLRMSDPPQAHHMLPGDRRSNRTPHEQAHDDHMRAFIFLVIGRARTQSGVPTTSAALSRRPFQAQRLAEADDMRGSAARAPPLTRQSIAAAWQPVSSSDRSTNAVRMLARGSRPVRGAGVEPARLSAPDPK